VRHQSASDLIRVLVSDDTRVHTELLADALKRDGRLQVTTASSGSEGLIGRLNHENIDVLLIGSNLDEQPGRGFDVLRGLQSSHGNLLAVMLLNSSKREMVLEAFRAGARGVFSKEESVETLSKCVRRVHEGQIWANTQQMAALVQALASSRHVRAVDARGMNLLSKREMEIVRSVAEGLTNREIAEQLGLSPHTVKNCLFRVFDKLGVSSRIELLFMTVSQNHQEQPGPRYSLQNQLDKIAVDDSDLVALQQAAKEGVLLAQLALAQFYSARSSDKNDATRSYMWYSIASEQLSRACGDATKGMTVEQLLQAERMAAEWLTQREKVCPNREEAPLRASAY
jgi:DNA-binding NarL/FixJ family response regulator